MGFFETALESFARLENGSGDHNNLSIRPAETKATATPKLPIKIEHEHPPCGDSASFKGLPLKSGWRKNLNNLPADFRQSWREIVERRCQGGELRPIAEALAYCDVEEAFAAWQKYH